MKQLIKVQATINFIEDTTLEVRYHSTFNYQDDKNLIVKAFCWEQASAYKNIFDRMTNVTVYMEANSVIRFVDTSENKEVGE